VALQLEVVKMTRIAHQDPRPGRESGPVRVDHVVLAFDHGVDDEGDGDGKQGN
jgi:hypothetical protein